MGSNAFGLIELVGVFALLLGALGWQWVSIRRTIRADAEEKADEERRTTRSPD